MTGHWDLDFAIAALATAIVFVIHCNIWYWPGRWRMTPEERRADDDEYRRD